MSSAFCSPSPKRRMHSATAQPKAPLLIRLPCSQTFIPTSTTDVRQPHGRICSHTSTNRLTRSFTISSRPSVTRFSSGHCACLRLTRGSWLSSPAAHFARVAYTRAGMLASVAVFESRVVISSIGRVPVRSRRATWRRRISSRLSEAPSLYFHRPIRSLSGGTRARHVGGHSSVGPQSQPSRFSFSHGLSIAGLQRAQPMTATPNHTLQRTAPGVTAHLP
jgi:hypothetical protein